MWHRPVVLPGRVRRGGPRRSPTHASSVVHISSPFRSRADVRARMELKPATWASRVSGSRLGVQLDAKNAMEMVDAPATAQCTASVPVAAQVTASTRRTTPQASLACCSAPPLGALSVLDPSHCVHLAIRPFILCLLAAEHRSANRAAAAGSKADWTKFNPWVSGGEAPHSLLPLASPLARLPPSFLSVALSPALSLRRNI